MAISDNKLLKMNAGSFYIPKNRPNKPRGEDAHFISTEARSIGLADGVSGLSARGIDSGEYARQLMQNCLTALQNSLHNGDTTVNPKTILQEAYDSTAVKGASTACTLTLSGNKLRAANIGDSGFYVIRDGEISYKSPTQVHKFNCPYQLRKGGKEKSNPSKAVEIEFPVESGDVIVAGTDGLLDNVHGRKIEKILREYAREVISKQAKYIARVAWRNSIDESADTPYSRRGRRRRRGGKPDDITVVVARIQDSRLIFPQHSD